MNGDLRGTAGLEYKGVPAMIKSALVTGAGGGLGRAVALALAARGCTVVALDINGPAVEETAAEAASGLITPLVWTSPLPAPRDLAVAESIAALGGLDIVVNNAGWGIGEAFLAMTEASWDRTLALNLKAVALICAAAGRHMKDARRRPHRQRDVAGVADGIAELPRLRGEQGRR